VDDYLCWYYYQPEVKCCLQINNWNKNRDYKDWK